MTAIEQSSKLAIRALEQMRGDDLARLENQAKRLSADDRQKEWGTCGRTFDEILSGARNRDDKIREAIEWVEACARR